MREWLQNTQIATCETDRGGSCYDAGSPARALCPPEKGTGQEVGRRLWRDGAHTCLRLIPIAVGQKPTWHKLVTLQ